MKKIAILPTLLTLGNAVCGFAAIAMVSKIGQGQTSVETNEFYLSLGGWLIIGAMVFDALDGYVARLAKTASEFGGQLDSLCDAISFGAAPAFLLLRLGPGWDKPRLHQGVVVIATLYMVCAVLRLARFNVQNTPDVSSHKRFRGLPSPGAAGCLASLAILHAELAARWPDFPEGSPSGVAFQMIAAVGALVVALLMVSRVSYPHVTKQLIRSRRRFSEVVQLILAAFLIWLLWELALVFIFWGYALGVAIYSPIRNWQRRVLTTPAASFHNPPH